ncbi:MAG: DUF2061 domain-containing protein [Pseudomonadota bacterium]
METKSRIAVKAITWQALGFFVMAIIGLIATGSLAAGGGIAAAGALLGFVSYFGHELLWSKVHWGRRDMS